MFAILKKMAWFFKLRWRMYGIGVIALFFTAILAALVPFIIGQLTDHVVDGTLTGPILLIEVGGILLSALLTYGLRYVWRTSIFGSSTLLESMLRNRLYDHFTKMDAEFYHKYRTGDLMAHATNDLTAVKFVAGSGIIFSADAVAQGGVTLLSMIFLVDWRLTLLAIIPLPALIVVSRGIGKIANRRYRRVLDAFSEMNNHVQESVSGMKVIKSFGEEAEDNADFQGNLDRVVDTNLSTNRINALYLPVIQWIMGVTYTIAIVFGSYLISQGSLSIGQLVSFFSYLGLLRWPFIALGRLANILEQGNAAYDRIDALLDEKSHIGIAEQPLKHPVEGKIDFAVDRFQYPDGDETVLDHVAFELKPGQTLGIAGRTGAGKSSIFKLLMREYDQYDGQIQYDDIDIRDYDRDYLTSNIGYVSQDNFLFSTTVGDNIRFGRTDLSDEEVRHYAQIADVDEDIMNFEDGYDTRVGERGVSLSGGQKQRIALARALAMDPEIMILDDSLSAVDAKTESEILANLKTARNNRTTIIAAHRISSIMHADEIIVVDDGKIVERGTHDELVKQGGWYNQMYQNQQLAQQIQGNGGNA